MKGIEPDQMSTTLKSKEQSLRISKAKKRITSSKVKKELGILWKRIACMQMQKRKGKRLTAHSTARKHFIRKEHSSKTHYNGGSTGPGPPGPPRPPRPPIGGRIAPRGAPASPPNPPNPPNPPSAPVSAFPKPVNPPAPP